MIGHPLPGHRWAQVTRNFSDPELEEQEALLRNAAPELYEAAKKTIEAWDSFDGGFVRQWLEEAIAKAEGRA